jgi:hypothetical protein
MPNYLADPDIRSVAVDGRFVIPEHLEGAEVERLDRFLRADQALETFYRRNPPPARPPEEDLRAAAETAMHAYEQRSERLPVGWQKFLVLQAGIAGGPENLDSSQIKEWAYVRITEENPDWLGDFDDDVDREMPLRWLTQTIGVDVLLGRQLMAEPAAPKKRRWFGR